MKKIKWLSKKLIPIFLISMLFAPHSLKAEISRAKLTATYLFRLAENIQWANEAGIKRYHIHLIDDDNQVARELKGLSRTKQLHGKPFQITRSSRTELPQGAHLVYMDREKAEDYPLIFKQAEGRNILLVSYNVLNKRIIMINLFDTPNREIRFEINKANIINQNMGINPDIILMGGTEIDVAKIYKEAQVSLREQEKHIADLEEKRRSLDSALDKVRRETEKLNMQVAEQQAEIRKQSDMLSDQVQLIKKQREAVAEEKDRFEKASAKAREQERIIEEQKKRFDEEHNRYEALASQSRKQQEIIDRQKTLVEQERKKYDRLTKDVRQREAALLEQAKKIEARSAILAEQDRRIEGQEKTIRKQETVLERQSDIIAGQRNFLYALVVGVFLIGGLAVTIFQGYRNKKVTNARLLEQQQLLKKSSGELASANEKLKELDRLKSMFIASMSHELRTPLNSIIGFTGMTLQGLSGKLNEEQKDNLGRAYNSAKHLLGLISDVIDISKIEASRTEVFPEAFSLGELMDEAIETINPQVKEKGLAVDVYLKQDVELYTDRKRLLQCLLNFLSNAVKFTEAGKITVVERELNGNVEISVTDTGIGIAKSDIPKLFEAFEQLHTHLRVKAGGTGLGLYLTRKMATELLHGTVSVESREGQGSTFTLKIPKDIKQVQDSFVVKNREV